MESTPSRQRWAAICVLVFAAIVAAFGNGASRPLDAHEAFVARSATEMLRRDDWVLPYFNGQPRLQKPPLNYWCSMLVHELSGSSVDDPVSEWQARAPSALGGVLLVALTMLLARTLKFGATTAWLAGAMLASCTGFFDWAHSAQPEMLYAALCAIELVGFAAAWRAAREGRSTWRACLVAWCGAALATLAKGPLLPTFLFVGVTLAAWFARDGAQRPRRVLRPLVGLAIVLAFALPWVLLVVHREPGAPEYWRSQMFDRTGGVDKAWWRPLEFFYVGATAKLAAPWSFLAFASFVWAWRTRSSLRTEARWLAWTFLVPLVVLGFSAKPKGYYLLPALAPLFVLMGHTAVVAYELLRARAVTWAKHVLRFHAALGFIGATALLAYLFIRAREFGAAPVGDAVGAIGAFLAGSFAFDAWRFARTEQARSARATALALVAVMGGASVAAVDPPTRRYEEGAFARELGQRVPRERPLYLIAGNSQVVTYYTDRSVEDMAPEVLAKRLAETPEAWIVATPERLKAAGVSGRVLYRVENDGEAIELVEPDSAAGATR